MITNFFQIQKLVFAHGYYSHVQISKLINFYVYKNLLLVACEIVFQAVSGFSRERFFLNLLDSSYNLVLSTLQAFVAIIYENRRLNQELQMMEPI